LEKEKIDSIVVFKTINAYIHENGRIYEDSLNRFCRNPSITTFVIYSNQINKDDPSNLLAWAQTLDNLLQKQKVFIEFLNFNNIFFFYFLENFCVLV